VILIPFDLDYVFCDLKMVSDYFAAKRIQQLAERARKLVPDITSVHYQKKEKKGKKKKVPLLMSFIVTFFIHHYDL
jgi:hypothetical protein